MNQTVWKYEPGDKKSIFGRPYTYNGTKWVPDEGVKTDNKGREKVGANVSPKEADKFLKENGIEHIDMLSTKSVRKLFEHHGIDWRAQSPKERLNELIKIYGTGSGTKKEEKPKEEKPKEEKPKEEKTQSTWKPSKDLDEAKVSFAKSVPSYNVVVGLRVSVETVNNVHETLHNTVASSPRIQKVLERSTAKKSIVILDVVDVKTRSQEPKTGNTTMGTYTLQGGKIMIGRGLKKQNHLTIGDQGNIGNGNQKSLINHEFGHHMYYSDKEAMRKFHQVYDKMNLNSVPKWSHPVSMYASTSPSECFAECFAAFFHPDYTPGKKGKSLPGPLHDLFTELYGERKK